MAKKKKQQPPLAATPPKAPPKVGTSLAGALAGVRANLDARATEAAEARARAAKEREAALARGRAKESEAAALARAYVGVAPVHGKARAVPVAQGAPRVRVSTPSATPADDLAARARLTELVSGGVRFDVTVDEDGRLVAYRVDHGPHLLKSLRGVRVRVEGSVDLHGATGDEAEERLIRFLRESVAAGRRVVRVIHGKGAHSEGGAPVLRGRVHDALTRGRGAGLVLAALTPTEADGGLGATLVHLAKR